MFLFLNLQKLWDSHVQEFPKLKSKYVELVASFYHFVLEEIVSKQVQLKKSYSCSVCTR